MKKISMLVAAFILSISLLGCGMNKNKEVENTPDKTAENKVVEENNDNQGIDDVDNNDVNHDTENETRIEVAQEAADRIAELEEVDSATVVVTNQNAYAAVVLHDKATEELTGDLEDKIAEKVREEDNNIQNVYVSLNPDFVERMEGYRTRINEGEPVEGFFEEFTESVQRVFPDAH